VSCGAHRHPQSGGGLPLAIAGENDQQSFAHDFLQRIFGNASFVCSYIGSPFVLPVIRLSQQQGNSKGSSWLTQGRKQEGKWEKGSCNDRKISVKCRVNVSIHSRIIAMIETRERGL
jgi:hypothetical protein